MRYSCENVFKIKISIWGDEMRLKNSMRNPIYYSLLLLVLMTLIIVPTTIYAQESTENLAPKQIICPNCGELNDAGSAFCWNDGFDLRKTAVPVKQETSKQTSERQFTGDVVGNMTETELEALLNRYSNRIIQLQRAEKNPESLENMTRAELEILIRKILREEKSLSPAIKQKSSGFDSFLKAVGGTVLFIIGMSILLSA